MRTATHKNYLLGLLTVILLFNYVDRLALGVVLQDIKAEFHLSDTELGLLSGIAFAFFYSVMGVPIARWADRGNRVTIIALSVISWSIAVFTCGLAASFVQLLLIRVVVAVGEAGCSPPSLSLMADYFTRAERPRATAIYGVAGVLSALVGYLLAGWLNEIYGWRITFMLLGLPGVVLGVLAWFSLREPRLESPVSARAIPTAPPSPIPSMMEVGRVLWTNKTFRYLLICFSVQTFFLYGIGQWHVPFFIRSYGLATGEIGVWLTVVWGLGGLAGTYLGGSCATRFAPQNERLQLIGTAIAIASAGVLTIFVYLSPNAYTAFTLMGLGAIGLTIINGPLMATIQTLAPERMRAVSFALVFLCANLIGAGLGPLATGALSDLFHSWAGEESLRYALLTLAPGYFVAAGFAWRASRSVTRDLAAALDDGSLVSGHEARTANESATSSPRLSARAPTGVS